MHTLNSCNRVRRCEGGARTSLGAIAPLRDAPSSELRSVAITTHQQPIPPFLSWGTSVCSFVLFTCFDTGSEVPYLEG